MLVVHNYYQQPGGEDAVYANESALLERYGHTVSRFEEHNDHVRPGPGAAIDAIWSRACYRKIVAQMRRQPCDVAHFHNTFPRISPSAYSAVRGHGAAVVQTLHNFRLICPSATLFREGSPCEECLTKRSLAPALAHRCYRKSLAATGTLVTMLATHRALGTWSRNVDLYIALSEFARRKLIAGGLPEERVTLKPNFVANDPGMGHAQGDYALFAGRLTEEKGLRELARAWAQLRGIPLRIAGDGPLRDIAWPPNVTCLGWVPPDRLQRLMQEARVLIFPSIWYECAPMTILEAFACGLPVIASDLGSIPELVTHGKTGLLFRPDDVEDLAQKIRWAWEHPGELAQIRERARREYQEKYTPERNYQLLLAIYERAIEQARRRA